MELQERYQTAGEQQPERQKPDRGYRTAESLRGTLSLPAICIALGLSILLSILTLGIAVSLISQLNEMKWSDAGFRMELSQWKRNVTQTLIEKKMSDAHVLMELSQWKMTLIQMLGEMKMSDADFQMDHSHWESNVTGFLEDTSSSLSKLQVDTSRLRNNPTSYSDGWTVFQQKQYHMSSSSESWSRARESCRQMGADLVVIDSAEEQDFLKNQIRTRHWLGLTDFASEGDWRWVDGTEISSSVNFWSQGEPNDAQDEDCGEMFDNGYWNDLSCENPQHWICEKPTQ